MNSNQCGRILEHKQQRKGKRASVASFSVTKFFFLSSYLLHFSVQICPFSSREIIVNRPLLRSTRSRDFSPSSLRGLSLAFGRKKVARTAVASHTAFNAAKYVRCVLGGCEGFCSSYWRFLHHPTALWMALVELIRLWDMQSQDFWSIKID